MLDIITGIEEWINQKKRFALATVIRTWGSSPRPISSALAVSADMEMLGSVSGGCVEGAVMKAALRVMETQKPEKLKFGVSDEEAWAVGLSCGGAIHVWLEPFWAYDEDEKQTAVWHGLQNATKANEGTVLIRGFEDGKNAHSLWSPEKILLGQTINDELSKAAEQAYKERKHQLVTIAGKEYFLQVFPRKSQLLIVGAAHITSDLVQLGNLYGFETIVIDPRGIFANKTQFSDPPHQLFVEWPAEVLPSMKLDAYSFAVLLTHDPKIDDQALHLLLQSDIAYIGALGSRRTHEKRVKRLTDAGFSEPIIERIHGPVGVAINAKRPKEIALSILAEIIQVKNQFL